MKETAEMDAEDVVQDVLLKILERGSSTLTIENMTAYIYRSLRNRVIDYRRTLKPIQSLNTEVYSSGERLIDLLQDHRPNALELLQTRQGKQELFEAFGCLSAMEKQVIVAHELEGTPFKELAIFLRIPQNTLLSHKSRAMKKLNKYFSDRLGD
jgi:RNA polymerase sigma factor (sigma-70 family)